MLPAPPRPLRFAAALALLAAALSLLPGCGMTPRRAPTLQAPWAGSRTLAVAPLLNESGSAHADGVRLADRLTERLNGANGVGTLPVNRVLAAMERLGLSEVRSEADAAELRAELGVDGLVAGTVTAFDPYDPPKIGLNLGVFYRGAAPEASAGAPAGEDPRVPGPPDLRELARAPRPPAPAPDPPAAAGSVAAVSRVYNAADPATQDALARFSRQRGTDYARSDTDARLYRISSDLFADFVAREAASDLLAASTP